MTGWHISVYRQRNGGENPSAFGDERGDRLVVWQAEYRGVDWIEALVKEGRAVDLGGNYYPKEFSARAKEILPFLEGEPPDANRCWTFSLGDVIGSGWEGRTTKSAEVIAACRLDEWVMIQVWDES